MNLQYIDESRRLADSECVRLRDIASNKERVHEYLLGKRDESHEKAIRQLKAEHAKAIHELLDVLKESRDELKIARDVFAGNLNLARFIYFFRIGFRESFCDPRQPDAPEFTAAPLDIRRREYTGNQND